MRTLTAQLIKKDGKLVYAKKADEILYRGFLDNVQEGELVNVCMDIAGDRGTLTDVARVHAMIRTICEETGSPFLQTKNEVKKRAGLCNKEGVCRSFADLSHEEFKHVVEVLIEIGEALNLNLR